MASIAEFKEIPLNELVIGTGQVRMREVAKGLDELVESIRQVGLLEPIVVCPTDEDNQYEIITGQRRFLAHKALERETIWAAVLDERVNEITAKILSVTENVVRKDLNSSDLIDVCTYLYKQYGTIKAVSEETGLSSNLVSRYVKYEQLVPELKSLVDNNEVKLDTALRAQQAATLDHQTNAQDAIIFAKEMEPLSGAQRSQMVKERHKDPSRPVDDIIESAKSGSKITQVVVTLTSEVHSALGKYAKAHDTNQDDAAGMLIRDGLFVHDYLDDSQ